MARDEPLPHGAPGPRRRRVRRRDGRLFAGSRDALEAEVLPARIPLAWILGIYGAGAVVVGSVERAKWLKRALKKKR